MFFFGYVLHVEFSQKTLVHFHIFYFSIILNACSVFVSFGCCIHTLGELKFDDWLKCLCWLIDPKFCDHGKQSGILYLKCSDFASKSSSSGAIVHFSFDQGYNQRNGRFLSNKSLIPDLNVWRKF